MTASALETVIITHVRNAERDMERWALGASRGSVVAMQHYSRASARRDELLCLLSEAGYDV